MKTVLIAVLALTASFNAARADEGQRLDASILAQVVVSGGFMAPGMSNTTIYNVQKNGEVIRFSMRGRDFGPSTQNEVLVGKLSARDQLALERRIAQVREGKLVDVNPSSPTGADAPSVSYRVNLNGKSVSVALRAGNFHVYALQAQKKLALSIKELLDRAIRGERQ